MEPRSARATVAMPPGRPRATSLVPSIGSTATSTSGGLPLPTRSPMYSIGASSFSPSPMTTIPSMSTKPRLRRIESTAAWSAASFWLRPMNRAAASEAPSVTRTSSRARLRSIGVPRSRGVLPLEVGMEAAILRLLQQVGGAERRDRAGGGAHALLERRGEEVHVVALDACAQTEKTAGQGVAGTRRVEDARDRMGGDLDDAVPGDTC